MIALSTLWLPIVASAVAIFVLSSLVHMVFRWHNAAYHSFSNEEEVRAALQRSDPAPGEYLVPHCTDQKELRTPPMQQKFRDGPVGLVVLRARGAPVMGRSLVLWFVYTLGIAFVAGYIGSRTLAPGAPFAHVFRLIWTVSFLAFVGGSIQNAIWMGKPWASVRIDVLDGAIYAAGTGAVFASLWPH